MLDLYNLMVAELLERRCAHVHRFPPHYIASVGSHLFNLYNREALVLVEGGRIPDMRLHLMFVSPPGMGRTFFMEHFLRGPQALLWESSLDVDFEAATTEAGFVGTIKFRNGDVIRVPGIAETHEMAIVGIEEFAALTQMMATTYSAQLDTALLGALDSGWVYKRLAAGEIKYQTRLTLIASTQPTRFDLSSGLGRRFWFVYFVPNKKDILDIRIARRRSKDIMFNERRTRIIREGIKSLKSELKTIKYVEFPPALYDFLDKYDIVHYEEMLYERFLLGYTIMRGDIARKLKVRFDKTAERLCLEELKYRRNIRRGSEFEEVFTLLKDYGPMPLNAMRDRLTIYGRSWDQSTQLLASMQNLGLITVFGGMVSLPTSKKQLTS